MLLHVSVNKPSSGSLLLCFPKLMFIKIFSKNTSLWIHNDIFLLTILINITLAKHSSKPPDDGLLTETCKSI